MMEISKELFKAVMGREIEKVVIERGIIFNKHKLHKIELPVNDFFFKCKEWIYNIDNSLNILESEYNPTAFREDYIGNCQLHHYEDKEENCYKRTFSATSEQQAVFDACEWYLNKVKKLDEKN